MKYINHLITLLILFLFFSCNTTTNTDSTQEGINRIKSNKITIQGRILVEQTNQPPLGINTINISNKWKFHLKEIGAKGENERVFVDKQGYYRITIEKGDTIVFVPNHIIYNTILPNYTLTGFTEDTIHNFTVKSDSTSYYKIIENYPESLPKLEQFLHDTDAERLYTLSGIIKNKETGKLMKNILIYPLYQNTAKNYMVHHLTNEFGQFTITAPYNTLLQVGSFNSPSENIQFNITKDSIALINL